MMFIEKMDKSWLQLWTILTAPKIKTIGNRATRAPYLDGKLLNLVRESVCIFFAHFFIQFHTVCILVKAFLEGAKKKGLKSLTRAVQHCCKTFELKLYFPPTGLFLIRVEIPVSWKFSCSICWNIVWVMASLTSTDRISSAHAAVGLQMYNLACSRSGELCTANFAGAWMSIVHC